MTAKGYFCLNCLLREAQAYCGERPTSEPHLRPAAETD